MASDWVILSDFDGTITKEDASQLVLSRYAEGDWGRYDGMLSRGEMGFEDCVSRQFSLIKTPPSAILRDFDRFVSTRANFGMLVGFAREWKIPMTIVSGGLDFIIREFLRRNGLLDLIGLHIGRTSFTGGRMTVSFPPLTRGGSVCFKDDLVMGIKDEGKRVAYIGDGSSDYKAALHSDVPFAVKGSRLARLFLDGGRSFHEFDDFAQVVEALAPRLG